MTAYTGTVLNAAAAGELGRATTALLKFSLTGALASGDTITWPSALPNGKVKVVDLEVFSPSLDTNATPTGTFTIGDGTTANAYLTAKGAKANTQNSLAGQVFYKGDGASIGSSFSGLRDIVMTVASAVATGAATGDIFVRATVVPVG